MFIENNDPEPGDVVLCTRGSDSEPGPLPPRSYLRNCCWLSLTLSENNNGLYSDTMCSKTDVQVSMDINCGAANMMDMDCGAANTMIIAKCSQYDDNSKIPEIT